MKKGFRPEMRSKCIMIVGRYPSCEAALRILDFKIQYREAAVRLPFHLPNSQPVTFKDSDTWEGAINKPCTHSSMFLAWFKSNKDYHEARNIRYMDFPIHFEYKNVMYSWVPRQKRLLHWKDYACFS